MADYHLHAQPIQRSKGRTATAAAAYRAGELVHCQREGRDHDYRRRRGVAVAQLFGFSGTRQQLWNVAEAAEKQKNATTAKEYDVALPVELSRDQKIALATGFARHLNERHGIAVDLALHDLDSGNPHAHLLTTTREVGADGLSLSETKAPLEWSDKKRRQHGYGPRKAELEELRKEWEEHANAALEAAEALDRIDCRTLKEQGKEREPQVHEGPTVNRIEKRERRRARRAGREYQPATVKGAHNAAVRAEAELEALYSERDYLAALEPGEPAEELNTQERIGHEPEHKTENRVEPSCPPHRAQQLGDRALSDQELGLFELRGRSLDATEPHGARAPERDHANQNLLPGDECPARPLATSVQLVGTDRNDQRRRLSEADAEGGGDELLTDAEEGARDIVPSLNELDELLRERRELEQQLSQIRARLPDPDSVPARDRTQVPDERGRNWTPRQSWQRRDQRRSQAQDALNAYRSRSWLGRAYERVLDRLTGGEADTYRARARVAIRDANKAKRFAQSIEEKAGMTYADRRAEVENRRRQLLPEQRRLERQLAAFAERQSELEAELDNHPGKSTGDNESVTQRLIETHEREGEPVLTAEPSERATRAKRLAERHRDRDHERGDDPDGPD